LLRGVGHARANPKDLKNKIFLLLFFKKEELAYSFCSYFVLDIRSWNDINSRERSVNVMAAARLQINGQVKHGALKGRGMARNPANRFERERVEAFDDGWEMAEETAAPQTTLIRDASRSIVARNDSPDLSFDRSINPYRGCEHGCIYCFARPSHDYLGFSAGLDFETKIVFKPEAARLLEKEFLRAGYRPETMVLGSNTDPYQPVERALGITRSLLEVLERFHHPVSIVTKSAGVLRDLDILSRMAARNLARVYVSVTTLEPALARAMEPRAASPARRLAAISGLAAAGVPVGVMASPMIPGLNDAEMEAILEAAAKAGAGSAGSLLLRLPHELGALFTDWLQTHLPERAAHVLTLIRQSRDGQLNDPNFHSRFRGAGPYAEMLRQRFARAARQYGLDEERTPLDVTQFCVPRAAVEVRQMSLF
jgi:DNA repair photolyase